MKRIGLARFSIAFLLVVIPFFTPLITDLQAQSGYPIIDTTKLKAHYDFLGSFRDSTGNNVAAIPNNAELSEDRFCFPLNAVQLINTDSYLKVENHPSLDFTDTLSISFWIYLDSIPETETRIISKSDPEEPDSGSYWITVYPGPAFDEINGYPWSFSYTDSNGNIHTHKAEWGMKSGAWMFYTITFDGNSVLMYLGLEPVAIFTTESTAILPNDQPLWLGNSVGSGFTGKMDDILLYNRVISGEELVRIDRQSYLRPDMDRPTIETCVGDSIELISKARGPFVQYRFIKGSQVIQDGIDSICKILVQSEEYLGEYTCVSYNCREERRQYFDVKQAYTPGDLTITIQPRDFYAYENSYFAVELWMEEPVENPFFQWYHDGNPVGQNHPRLTIPEFSVADTGTYYCEITDGCHRIYSDTVHGSLLPTDSNPIFDATSLVLHYPFSGNFNDITGNTGPAVIHSVVLDSGLFSRPLHAAYFGGPDSYLEIPDDPDLDIQDQLTIAFALRINTLPGQEEPLITKSDGIGDSIGNYGLFIDSDLKLIFAVTGEDGTVFKHISNTNLQLGKWHLIAATYNGDELNIGVDRKFTTPLSVPEGSLKTDDHPLVIGNRSNGSMAFAMDDLKLFHRAMPKEEIYPYHIAHYPNVVVPSGDFSVCTGDTVVLEPDAWGPFIGWEILKDGVILQAGNPTSYVIPIISEEDLGTYVIHVHNGYKTREAKIEVESGKLYDDLSIWDPLQTEIYATAGEELIILFQTNHNYVGTSYEMYHNGELLPGVGKRYTIDQVTDADTGSYYFVIVNGCDRIISDTVFLIVEGLSYVDYEVVGWDWTGNISSAGDSYFSRICTGRDGSFYLLGHFGGGLKVEEEEVFSSLEDDIFIVKYSEDGAYQWSKFMQSTFHKGKGDLAVDSEGYVYVIGSFWNSIEIEDTTLSTNMVAGSGYMVKYNPMGEMLWIKELETTRGVRCDNIEIDALDRIYLGGNFSGSLKIDTIEVNGAWDQYANVMFVALLDSAGSCHWISHAVTDPFMDMFGLIDMELSKSGEVVASGTITGPSDFGNGVVLSTAIEAPFLVKYNQEGVAQWGTSLANDFSFAETFDVSVDDLDRIFLTGMHLGEIAFGEYSTESKGMVMEEIFLARFDSEGVCTALNSYGSLGEGGDFGVCYEPATDSTGYLLGMFGDTLVMKFDTLVAGPVSGGGGAISPNMFIAKLKDDGEPLVLKSAGVLGNHFFGEILVRDDGRLYFAGLNEGVSVKKGSSGESISVAFVGYLEHGIVERVGPLEVVIISQETICLGDSINFMGHWHKEAGSYSEKVSNPMDTDSIFTLKLVTEICVSTEDALSTVSYMIYPNPASQVLFVKAPEGVPFDLQVYGISGNLVLQRTDQIEYELDIQDYQPGLYVLKLSGRGAVSIHKVLIE